MDDKFFERVSVQKFQCRRWIKFHDHPDLAIRAKADCLFGLKQVTLPQCSDCRWLDVIEIDFQGRKLIADRELPQDVAQQYAKLVDAMPKQIEEKK